MKILFELRTAINVSGNSFLTLSHGNKRVKQYFEGLMTVKGLLSTYIKQSKCDVVLVDNTLINDSFLPDSISQAVPNDSYLYVKQKNDYGKYNKGAGDIELWKDYSEILEDYDYFFHYEPRMLLKDSSFIKSFIDNPRNCFCLAGENQVKTGYFGVNVKDFKEFYEQVDLNDMVSRSISIEYMMFDFFKNKEVEFQKDKHYCLWHDAANDQYVEY